MTGVAARDLAERAGVGRVTVYRRFETKDKLVQAQLRLTASGYFDSAFLVVDPESDPAAAPVQAAAEPGLAQHVAEVRIIEAGVGEEADGFGF